MAEQRYRVMNMCKYDIGVELSPGHRTVVKAGSFQLMTADEISYVESICAVKKFFASRMLVPYDSVGKEVDLNNMGMFVDEEAEKHLSDEEIASILKQPVKKIEAYVNEIEDPTELHAIYEVAKTLDLPASKLKVLTSKMPDKDFLED